MMTLGSPRSSKIISSPLQLSFATSAQSVWHVPYLPTGPWIQAWISLGIIILFTTGASLRGPQGGEGLGLGAKAEEGAQRIYKLMELQRDGGRVLSALHPLTSSLLCPQCLEERSWPTGAHSEEHDQDSRSIYTLP